MTAILCIWTMVAIFAIIFIRGASPRVERTTQSPQRSPARISIGE